MSNRANLAALNAVLRDYIINGGYKNLANAISNYRIPANRKQNRTNTIARRRIANRYNGMSENNRTQANLRYDREFVMNLIRLGVASARGTRKQRANNAANAERKKKAGLVIKKYFVKSKVAGAKNARKRIAKERYAKYEATLKGQRAVNRARAEAERRAELRSKVGTAEVSRRGRTQVVAVSGGQRTTLPAANASRAQPPQPSGTLFRRAPNAGPLLSPSASAASQRTVNALVQPPSAGRGRAAPGPRAGLESTLKRLGRGRGR